MMPATKMMQMLLMLAPNLARLTVASPHLISRIAVAGYSLQSAHVQQRVQSGSAAMLAQQLVDTEHLMPEVASDLATRSRRASTPAMVAERIDIRKGPKVTQASAAPIKPELLVWKDDTWHSTSEISEELADGKISDATL